MLLLHIKTTDWKPCYRKKHIWKNFKIKVFFSVFYYIKWEILFKFEVRNCHFTALFFPHTGALVMQTVLLTLPLPSHCERVTFLFFPFSVLLGSVHLCLFTSLLVSPSIWTDECNSQLLLSCFPLLGLCVCGGGVCLCASQSVCGWCHRSHQWQRCAPKLEEGWPPTTQALISNK